ncbi:MAG: DUF2851 family protein [Prevotellaceae bacterium]|jgi:hypothetical protein|nr:DUF2851 family protein [Prevotellaceae bacterium]
MNEDFLQFIWSLGLYDSANLKTSEGECVEVISAGVRNRDSGPDFYNARIRIGEIVWAGTVEIHRKSSEWNLHGHQNDNAYNNVILHVVEKNDAVIKRKNGETIPCMEITCPENFKKRYLELSESVHHIPCANYISTINSFKVRFWLDRIAVERLERKTAEIEILMNETISDLEEVFHCVLFRYFGFKTNALPFEMLARSLPAKMLRKYSHSLLSVESLLFGQAGFLDSEEDDDEYFFKLKSEYRFLKVKHNLTAMDRSLWKFAKLRPVNFPTVRIAQLAAILNKYQNLWEIVVALDNTVDIYGMFDVSASEYWDSHYVFGKISPKVSSKRLGRNAVDNLIINVFAPMIFVYSVHRGDGAFKEKAIHFLESLPAETNSVISEWIKYGIKPSTALQTQALLHLRSEYCDNKKCLKCAIGQEVIRNILKKEN